MLAEGGGPHRVSALLDSGLTRGQLRCAVDAGTLLLVRRGIVVPRQAWADADLGIRRSWALGSALLSFPGSWGSHDSAVRRWGLPEFRLPRDDHDEVPRTHITRVGAARVDGWLTVHGCDTPPACVVAVDGIRTTDLVRTSIESAATRSLRGAIVLIDAAMRMAAQADHPERELREVVGDRAVVGALRLRWRYAIGAYAGHRWVTMVREAVELADPAAESVLESLSRHAIWCSTLPRPQIGVRLRGDDGRYYWVDMWWPDRQVFGEADGLSKYVGPEALIEEKRRHEALEGPGRRGVRWGWEQVYPDPARMIDRIRHALATPPTRREWS